MLSVSTIHPHKNWERWLEAYRMLVEEGLPHHLVIAGAKGKYAAELDALVAAKGLAGRVRTTGWIERSRLRELLKHAEALVFPSTFEGFGMPSLHPFSSVSS